MKDINIETKAEGEIFTNVDRFLFGSRDNSCSSDICFCHWGLAIFRQENKLIENSNGSANSCKFFFFFFGQWNEQRGEMRKGPFYRVAFLTLFFKWSNITDAGTLRDPKICNSFKEVRSFSSRWSELLAGRAGQCWGISGVEPRNDCRRLKKWWCVRVQLPLPQIHLPGLRLLFLNV